MADDTLQSAAATVAGVAVTWGTLAFLRSIPSFPRPWRATAAVAAGIATSLAVTLALRRADAGDPHAPPQPPPPRPKPTLVPMVLGTAVVGAAATGYSVSLLAVPRFGRSPGLAAAGTAALAVFGGVVALLYTFGREPR